MAATTEFVQSTGAGNTLTTIGSTGNIADFKANDSATIADYAANPVTAGQNSMEVWIRAHFIGSFGLIRDVRFYQTVDFAPNLGLQIFWRGTQTGFVQPVSSTSTIATSSIPTSDPGTANVSFGGSLSSSIVAASYSDYIVLQLRTLATAPGGDTSLTSLLLSYFEQ